MNEKLYQVRLIALNKNFSASLRPECLRVSPNYGYSTGHDIKGNPCRVAYVKHRRSDRNFAVMRLKAKDKPSHLPQLLDAPLTFMPQNRHKGKKKIP